MTLTTFDSPTLDAPELIRLLSEQRDLYQQLKAMADQQASLIQAGDSEQLLTLLSRRQGLVEQLTTVNEALAPFRDRLPGLADDWPDQQRQQVRQLSEQVQTLLRSILEQDERDRKQLESAQKQINGQISQVNRTGQALHAYRPKTPTQQPRFTDHKG